MNKKDLSDSEQIDKRFEEDFNLYCDKKTDIRFIDFMEDVKGLLKKYNQLDPGVFTPGFAKDIAYGIYDYIEIPEYTESDEDDGYTLSENDGRKFLESIGHYD